MDMVVIRGAGPVGVKTRYVNPRALDFRPELVLLPFSKSQAGVNGQAGQTARMTQSVQLVKIQVGVQFEGG